MNLWVTGYQSPFSLLHISVFLIPLVFPALFFLLFFKVCFPHQHFCLYCCFQAHFSIVSNFHYILCYSLSNKENFFILLIAALPPIFSCHFFCITSSTFSLCFFYSCPYIFPEKDTCLTGFERQRRIAVL